MKCAKCGQPLETDMPCPNCADDNVRVMSRAEKDSYDGITIEADENEARRQEEAEREGRAYQYGGTARLCTSCQSWADRLDSKIARCACRLGARYIFLAAGTCVHIDRSRAVDNW